MLRITDAITLPESELEESFIRASGPGGQNVNKVASAVQLRFHVLNSPSLPNEVKVRLVQLAGKRLSKDGELVIEARRFRTQERNREDARARLADLVRRAASPPRPRKPTKIPLAEKRRRVENKRRRAETKARRTRIVDE